MRIKTVGIECVNSVTSARGILHLAAVYCTSSNLYGFNFYFESTRPRDKDKPLTHVKSIVVSAQEFELAKKSEINIIWDLSYILRFCIDSLVIYDTESYTNNSLDRSSINGNFKKTTVGVSEFKTYGKSSDAKELGFFGFINRACCYGFITRDYHSCTTDGFLTCDDIEMISCLRAKL